MIKAIIFDAYGVLITDALVPLVEELRTRDLDRAQQAFELLRATSRGQIPHGEFIAQLAAVLGMEAEDLHEVADQGEAKNTPPLEYVLKLRKHYKTALLSNISMQGLGRRFSKEELDRYFDVVVPSGEIGYIKPELQAYLITAERLGVKPAECIMIDDREVCCEGARAVGMQAILYESLIGLINQLTQLSVDS